MIYDDAYLFLLFTVCSADLVQLVFCGSFSYHVKFYTWFVQRLEFLKKSGKGRWSRKKWFLFCKATTSALQVNFFSFWSALIQYRPYVWLVMFCYVCMFCCAVRVHCLKTDNTWNDEHSWTWIKIIMACSNNKLFQLP